VECVGVECIGVEEWRSVLEWGSVLECVVFVLYDNTALVRRVELCWMVFLGEFFCSHDLTQYYYAYNVAPEWMGR
jgi:hypothetical protein